MGALFAPPGGVKRYGHLVRLKGATAFWYGPLVRLKGATVFWYGHLLRIHGESRSIAKDPSQVARSVAMDRYSPKIRCDGPIFAIDLQQ